MNASFLSALIALSNCSPGTTSEIRKLICVNVGVGFEQRYQMMCSIFSSVLIQQASGYL